MKRYDLIDGQMVEKTLGDYVRYDEGVMREQAAAIANLRAQLARQQAPVGDSVDTPEFRHLLDDFADEGNLEVGNLEVIQFIHAWKDAQLARERQDIGERSDEAKRLRRVVNLLGMQREVPEDDETLRGALFAVLGQIARKLETAPAAQEQGEPVAYVIYGIGGGKHFISDVKLVKDAPDGPENWKSDDGSLGCFWAGNEPLVLGPAPQSDEVRDAALEEAAKAIRSLKRTTAADNQKGGDQ